MAEPLHVTDAFTIYVGDVREALALLPDESVNMCVTSPPYWGLRDYSTAAWNGGDPDCDHVKGEMRRGIGLADSPATTRGGAKKISKTPDISYGNLCGKCGAERVDKQLGLEATPEEYVANMVEVFRGVRRVLRNDGTLWLNIGDSYAATRSYQVRDNKHTDVGNEMPARVPEGLKQKDLVGVPWMLAFALRSDGWYLRSDIIWSKPNPMPESIRDRPTKAHEYLFLLTKSARYFYDANAIREPAEWARWGDQTNWKHEGSGSAASWIQPKTREELNANRSSYKPGSASNMNDGDHVKKSDAGLPLNPLGRNKRSVWHIATQPYSKAHFAVFPEKLVEPCILAGCPEWVCATCGKPRMRIEETSNPSKQESEDDVRGWANTHSKTSNPQSSKSLHRNNGGVYSTARTVGWTDCGHDDYVPGTVLDPFLGSGTTAQVARSLERNCIGIELNSDYVSLAIEHYHTRTKEEKLTYGNPVPQVPGQLEFDIGVQ